MEEIEVPPYFLCPISLQIMRDPVTISTGITYDRESIEKWIFSGKNNTCPVTKQAIVTPAELTPNIILRRYIQSWCTLNASHGVERFPTPKAPVSKSQIVKLLSQAKSPEMQMQCLRRLSSIASESEANRRSLENAGAAEFLVSIIRNNSEIMDDVGRNSRWGPRDEALSILYNLKLSDKVLKCIGQDNQIVESLVRAMQRHEHDESRAFAAMLLRSMVELAGPLDLMGLNQAFYVETVQILKDKISQKATKEALQLLINVCPLGRNRIKAAEAGAAAVLVDLLLDTTDKRATEMILMLLDQLCQCADGRADLLSHPAGLAVVSKKILRVSHAASERAVKILYSVSRFSATSKAVQEMLGVGVAAKLCLVMQVECGKKTKEWAKDILRMHAKYWKNSQCIPIHFTSSYPSDLRDIS